MAIRAISLLQRISLDMAYKSCKCTHCVCLCMCVCAGLNTFLVYLACSLSCAMYTISVFSLDLWKGKVLCIRPSLAIGAHWHTYTLGHTIRLCGGGGGGGVEGKEDNVVGMQLCRCVW